MIPKKDSTADVVPTPAPSSKQEGQTDSEYLDTWLKYANANKPESDAEKKQRERLERTQGVVNGIGDLGRAIANMYFTTQYAPNGYDESKSLTAPYQARLEKAKKERRERNADYMTAIEHIQKYKDNERAFNLQKEKQAFAQQKWEAEEERKNAISQASVERYNATAKYYDALANKNEAQAKMYEEQMLYLQAKVKYLEFGYNLKQAETQAHIEVKQALAEKYRREADGTTTTTTIERDNFGNETGRTITKTPDGGGNTSSSQKKANPMGGSTSARSGKKKNPMSE